MLESVTVPCSEVLSSPRRQAGFGRSQLLLHAMPCNIRKWVLLLGTPCAALTTAASALGDPGPGQFCAAACQQALSGVEYAGKPFKEDGACANELHITSLLYCLKLYCPPAALESNYQYLRHHCSDVTATHIPSLDSVANMTRYDLARLHMLAYQETPIGVVNTPSIPDRQLFNLIRRTLVSLDRSTAAGLY